MTSCNMEKTPQYITGLNSEHSRYSGVLSKKQGQRMENDQEETSEAGRDSG